MPRVKGPELWQPQGYECKEANGSLKVGSRRELYCPTCEADDCLFGGPTPRQLARWEEEEQERERKSSAKSRAALKGVARLRAKGLSPRGEPLLESCWNCAHVRSDTTGYVCRFAPDAAPVGRYSMTHRRGAIRGCQGRFEMRLGDVEYLGEGS